MIDYDSLKKNTYLFLLNNDEFAQKLIQATLLISLCHDNCIHENHLFVTPNFIKNCCQLVPFELNYEKMSKISDEEKFSLIRNKLAHGDYVYNEETQEIYIKHRINEEEVITSIKLHSIINFAKEISKYYNYLDSQIEHKKIMNYYGVKMTIIDHPNKGKQRNDNYNSLIDLAMNRIKKRILNDLSLHPERKKYTVNIKNFILDIYVEKTDEPNMVIENPEEEPLVRELALKLNNQEYTNKEYQEIIELLHQFYIVFIYPLENFLKDEDKNVYSLQNDKMFNFSLLNLKSIDNPTNFTTVGKIDNYFEDLNRCYEKIGILHLKKDKLKNIPKEKIPSFESKINEIEEEIEKITNLFCDASVKLIHEYSKNRSVIEHLRCSMMHGNYSYNENNKTLTFVDTWHKKELYRNTLTIKEFKNLFHSENINLIIEQFTTTYKNNKSSITKKK